MDAKHTPGQVSFAYTRHWQGPVVHVVKTTSENAILSPRGRVPLSEIVAWFSNEEDAYDAVRSARQIDFGRQTSDERKALQEKLRSVNQELADYDRETRRLSNEAAIAKATGQ